MANKQPSHACADARVLAALVRTVLMSSAWSCLVMLCRQNALHQPLSHQQQLVPGGLARLRVSSSTRVGGTDERAGARGGEGRSRRREDNEGPFVQSPWQGSMPC